MYECECHVVWFKITVLEGNLLLSVEQWHSVIISP